MLQYRDDFLISTWNDPWVPSLSNFIPIAKEGSDWSSFCRVADWKSKDRWNDHIVRDIFEPDSVEAILAIEWPIESYVDKLVWLGNEGKGFTVGSSYTVMFRE